MNYGSNKEPEFLPDFKMTSILDRWGSLDTELLYIGYFDAVASQYTFANLDMENFYKEFQKNYNKAIHGYHFKKFNLREDWKSDHTFVLEKEIIVHLSSDEVTIFFRRQDCELLEDILSFCERLKKDEEHKSQINLIISRPHGLDNKKISFDKPNLELDKIYNDDFLEFHHRILLVLAEENQSGLHLLYGNPGTGKSTYIRYLCGLVKKEIVFLPGQMAENLDNIEMTRYLMNNINCILVIEDAEELIATKAGQRNSNLAMILNITDGILGESLGIQIIATFNTDVKNIDPALKRRGRLKTAYEFKALSQEKATLILREQNPEYSANDDMTLAEIFNITQEEQYNNPARNAVGFRSGIMSKM